MKNTFKIWSSDISSLNEETLQEYEELFFENFGYTPNESELHTYISEDLNRLLDDELSELDAYERKHGTKHYVIFGSIHRWHGDIFVGKVVETMEEVISTCSHGETDIDIYFKNGLLRIDGYNHDSDCSGDFFEIRELTDRGYQYYVDHENDMDDVKLAERLFNDSHYSHRVTIFNKIYGC